MEDPAIPASEPSIEERRFQAETTSRNQELALREREVAVKEEDSRRSRWLSPMVIALLAAAVGLLGNVVVATLNNQASQQLERLRSQSNLVLEAIKTGDQPGACRNLVFFVALGLLHDQNRAISKACSSAPQGGPALPANDTVRSMIPLIVRVIDKSDREVNGLRVYCQPKTFSELGLNSGVIPATTLSSPSTFMLSPGIYVCWAAHDNEPSVPVSDKVDAGISGGEVKVNIFLRIP
jgi:hypothetical protein